MSGREWTYVIDRRMEEKKEGFVVVLFIPRSLPLASLVSRAASMSEQLNRRDPSKWGVGDLSLVLF